MAIEADILVNWPQQGAQAKGDIACDYLCAALLDTPHVTSVTRSCDAGAATFRRGLNHPGMLVMPYEPHELLDKFTKLTLERQPLTFDARQQADRALQADWALRIARGDELRKDKPVNSDDVDWTITLERRREKGQPSIDRLEIRDRNGTVKVRRSLVQHFVPSRFFFFGFEGGSSADGFAGAKFTIGGSTISNQPRFHEFDGAVELLRSVNILGRVLSRTLWSVWRKPCARCSTIQTPRRLNC